jgi:hypothetical protein
VAVVATSAAAVVLAFRSDSAADESALSWGGGIGVLAIFLAACSFGFLSTSGCGGE